MQEALQHFAQYFEQLASLSHLRNLGFAFIALQGLFVWNWFRVELAEQAKAREAPHRTTKDPV